MRASSSRRSGLGIARITIGAAESSSGVNTTIKGNLQVVTGDGADGLEVTLFDVLGTGRISTGKGADLLRMDDAYFGRDFTLLTSHGADVVKIGTVGLDEFASEFDGDVRVDLGAGDDLLRLGLAGSVTSAVEVFRANRWDGGAGDDRVDADNVFTFGAEPSFVRFERYGTPPLFDRPAFFNVGSYDLGTELTGLVAADLNGDGLIDLATTDRELQQVHLLFGNGDGTFARGGSFAAGVSLRDLEVGDFDGKNGLDLVVANGGRGTISVLLNDGAGNFGASVASALAARFSSLSSSKWATSTAPGGSMSPRKTSPITRRPASPSCSARAMARSRFFRSSS